MSAIAFWRGVENAKKAAKGSTQMYENWWHLRGEARQGEKPKTQVLCFSINLILIEDI
jgi:hypothetical protein